MPDKPKMYASYSEQQRRQIHETNAICRTNYPAVSAYRNVNGDIVHITEVRENVPDNNWSKWPDAVYLGEVVEYLGRVE